MFRGFIPGKQRMSSMDLTREHDYLNDLSNAGGKENTPKMLAVHGPQTKGTPLGTSKVNAEKTKNGKATISKNGSKPSEQAVVVTEDTTQAFDKLLVRSFYRNLLRHPY